MKLILSTSNIISESPTIWRSYSSKSNAELISSLRARFTNPLLAKDAINDDKGEPRDLSWIRNTGTSLEIPTLDFADSALLEEREQYDITAKLFFLPGGSVSERANGIRDALGLVLKELHMPSIDLLIASFPGVYFDEKEDCPEKISTRGPIESEPEQLNVILDTWKSLESLQNKGLIKRLGVAEFSAERLETLLEKAAIPPKVNQINLRNCCSVPKDLMILAKSNKIDVLVHNDCSNILPRGTLRELLGPGRQSAGILAGTLKAGDKRKTLHGESGQAQNPNYPLEGELQPQWVIKYTAVVKNRGVVENKGYFAVAELTT